MRFSEDGKQSDVVVMDFTKAFDKVSHIRLLHKLHIYGINPETYGWSRSFLCSKTQHVLVDGEASKVVEITSGEPQGSVLEPSFFPIYINDMAEYTKCSLVRLFADNTIILITLTAENDCENIQEDL